MKIAIGQEWQRTQILLLARNPRALLDFSGYDSEYRITIEGAMNQLPL